MKLCHVVASLEAKYGGPSKSVRSISRGLAELGESVALLSTDPTTTSTHREGGLFTEIFLRGRPGALAPSAGLRRRLEQSDADIFHNHGLWLRPLAYARSTARRRGVPLVISPRGMMGAWAWQHHRLRKRLCSLLVHPGAIASAAGWHATSADEASDIRRLGITQPICVAPNGVSQPSAGELTTARESWLERIPAAATRPVALFYSRFHSKKRVKELIKLWVAAPTADWLLLIVGIAEEFDASELSAYAQSLGAKERIEVLAGEGQPAPYAIASLFLLPSHNENLGLSIAEAMAHGVPVLVTDTTPWAEMARRDLGWCVPWDSFPASLAVAIGEGTVRLRDRGAAARTWVLGEFSWLKSATLLRDFYGSLSSACHQK